MTPEPIPEGDLAAIVECGLFAPSAGNRQPWHFLVVTNRDLILKIAAAVAARVAAIMATMSSDRARKSFGDYNLFMTFFKNSSALILAYVEPYPGLLERLLARYAPDVAAPAGQTAAGQSVAAAIQNILLAAHGRGYAGCWNTGALIAKSEIGELVGVQEGRDLVGLVGLGHRDPSKPVPPAPARRPVAETVTYLK